MTAAENLVLGRSRITPVINWAGDLTKAGRLSVALITHKFREVRAFADEVTVLRAGRRGWSGQPWPILHRYGLFDLIVGACNDYGTY